MTIIKLKTLQDFKNTIFDIISKYDRKELNLMIPGGSVLSCLDDNRYEDLETSKWKIFFCDERMRKEYSNFESAKNFIGKIKGKVFPIINSKDNSSGAILVDKYENILENATIDVCLLGIGDNGHICSLWPDSDALDSRRMVEQVKVDCPLSPERITVTLEFINKSVKDLYFVIPPREKPKTVVQPAKSILERLKVKYTTIITDNKQ